MHGKSSPRSKRSATNGGRHSGPGDGVPLDVRGAADAALDHDPLEGAPTIMNARRRRRAARSGSRGAAARTAAVPVAGSRLRQGLTTISQSTWTKGTVEAMPTRFQ